MRHPRITGAAIAVALAATVGGVGIASAAGGSTPTHTARAGKVATVQTRTATVRGTTETILVDAKGLPLYLYQVDTPTTSQVTGQLAALWPPLVAATPTARGPIGTLSTVATSNGKQVAYNGHFLYTFIEDSPGHVTGQGVQNFFVATPGLAAGVSSTVPVSPSQSGTGY